MAITAQEVLQRIYKQGQALGAPALNSNFSLEIVGFENLWLNIKQAPWVTITPQGEVENPGPGGTVSFLPQPLKNSFQGPITIKEDEKGTADAIIKQLAALGQFDCVMYEGVPESFTRAKNYVNCFLTIDGADRDHENRAQILTWTGTLFFHYFGDDEPGNIG